jgi:hypothetical protein
MTKAAVSEVRKPGRPRKFAEGRINATIRFTPERYAELKAAADKNRRSVSEQVEAMIEELLHTNTVLAAMGTNAAAQERQVFRRRHRAVPTAYGDAWWPKEDPEGPGRPTFPIKMRRKR